MARIVRGQVLSIKNQEYVIAARSMGASRRTIIFRDGPHIIGPVIVYAASDPSVMLFEAFLSFLGLGVQAPLASWKPCLRGRAEYRYLPRQLIFPSATMALTLLSLNFVGDGLRDAFDPRARRS